MKRAVTRWLAYMLSALMMITGIGIMPAASATVHADGEKKGILVLSEDVVEQIAFTNNDRIKWDNYIIEDPASPQ